MTERAVNILHRGAARDEKRMPLHQAENASERRTLVLEIAGVTKEFGEFVALDDVSLSAHRGEFFTLLGPSGSGKTTLLRIIAGLEQATQVTSLRIAGEDVVGLPANERNVTTVFQHYALFPHMSVGDNVGYGLKLRRVAAQERRQRVTEALELVRLPNMFTRRIHQLSGGERQRVALARALVLHPDLLLLDEPLGALDERLRVEMQVELLRLQRTVGTTFVYVTHSQEEALTMSDRVVLMNGGKIVQEGSPESLYERPNNRFVANFMGVENTFDGVVEAIADDSVALRLGDIVLQGRWAGTAQPQRGMRAFAAVRGQSVHLRRPDDGERPPATVEFPCKALQTIYKGKYVDIVVNTPLGEISARLWEARTDVSGYSAVWWRVDDCVVGPAD